MKDRLFIVLEGIDGSGKSTQLEILNNRLKAEGLKVYKTCEPTDGPIGKMIRDIFNHRLEADHRTIAGLFVADRLDHLLNKTNGLLKMLDEDYVVISDRYYFSSYAYQSPFMPMDWVISANSMSAELLRADATIFIDVPPETCMQRLNKNRSTTELYETLENLKTVRAKYFEAFERLKSKENIIVIDGNRSPELIADDIWKQLKIRRLTD
jgi:dTMP kinase